MSITEKTLKQWRGWRGITATSLFAVCLLALCGCLEEDEEYLVPLQRYQAVSQQLAEAQAIQAATEQQLELVERDRSELKLEVERSEQGKALWKNSSAIMIVLAGLLTILGVGAGSSARNQAEHESP